MPVPIGHVTKDRLLVLRFDDIAPADSPSGESETELYTGSPTSAGDYWEIEPQGKQQVVGPGASLTWTVRFLLRALPAEITPAVGDANLVSYTATVR